MKKNQVIELYNERIKKYGNKAKAVGWKNEKTQFLRFRDLLEDVKIEKNSTVLDLGCGYGALLDFFKMSQLNFEEKNYVGIDFSEKMIAEASTRFPQANFLCSDFFDMSLDNYDFIVCSGALNIKIEKQDLYENLEKFLKKFLPLAKLALSFNLIHDMVDFKERGLNYYDLSKVVKLLSFFSRTFNVKNSSKLFESSITIFKK